MARVTGANRITVSTGAYGQQPFIEVNGRADHSNIAGLAGEINRLADEFGCCVSLDFAGVEDVDAAALEGIAEIASALRPRGQRLHLKSASKSVQTLIEKLFLFDLFCFERDCCGRQTCDASQRMWSVDVFSLPCSMSYCQEARTRVGRVASEVGFSDCLCSDVVLAVGEAVTNAITHGSACNREDSFSVVCVATSEKLSVSVSDHGQGFCPDDLPSFEDALLAEHGRGIYCMRSVMDEVSFHFDAGTTVRMVKRSEQGI